MTDASTPSVDQSDEEGLNREQEMERRSHRLQLPEDGYEWKKYGQKFIKNIGKFRSYFKCQRENCMAKKRAEWRESGEIRIVYEGVHTHGSFTDQHHSSSSSASATPSSNANQYNLLTQFQAADSAPSPPHD